MTLPDPNEAARMTRAVREAYRRAYLDALLRGELQQRTPQHARAARVVPRANAPA